jgi:hypothetical protein
MLSLNELDDDNIGPALNTSTEWSRLFELLEIEMQKKNQDVDCMLIWEALAELISTTLNSIQDLRNFEF